MFGVIFDLDGTLIDTTKTTHPVESLFLYEHGLDCLLTPERRADALDGMSFPLYMELLKKASSVRFGKPY